MNEVKEIALLAVEETFKKLNLLTCELIAKAKEETSTKEEYDAFMRGAAFVFYCVCERSRPQWKEEEGNMTLEDAIQHCEDLLPFLAEREKTEHLRLIGWLKELKKYRKNEG